MNAIFVATKQMLPVGNILPNLYHALRIVSKASHLVAMEYPVCPNDCEILLMDADSLYYKQKLINPAPNLICTQCGESLIDVKHRIKKVFIEAECVDVRDCMMHSIDCTIAFNHSQMPV